MSVCKSKHHTGKSAIEKVKAGNERGSNTGRNTEIVNRSIGDNLPSETLFLKI